MSGRKNCWLVSVVAVTALVVTSVLFRGAPRCPRVGVTVLQYTNNSQGQLCVLLQITNRSRFAITRTSLSVWYGMYQVLYTLKPLRPHGCLEYTVPFHALPEDGWEVGVTSERAPTPVEYAIGKCAGWLPLSIGRDWLRRRTNEFYFTERMNAPSSHDSPNDGGPANGSQPIRSETNRTSSAAGSRR